MESKEGAEWNGDSDFTAAQFDCVIPLSATIIFIITVTRWEWSTFSSYDIMWSMLVTNKEDSEITVHWDHELYGKHGSKYSSSAQILSDIQCGVWYMHVFKKFAAKNNAD